MTDANSWTFYDFRNKLLFSDECVLVYQKQKRKDAGSTGKRVTAETGCIRDGVRKCKADADGGLSQGAGRGMAENGVRGEASNHH